MTLARVLEPEIMSSEQEAADYDEMDHGSVNAAFAADAVAAIGTPAEILDVGTGTALIPIAMAERAPDAFLYAADLSLAMLARARDNVRQAGFARRIALLLADATELPWPTDRFDAVVSNSIVHHIPEPARMLSELVRVTKPGGCLFVRDLIRPETDEQVEALVATYAPLPVDVAPDVRARHERQRALFDASLRAALRVDEVRACVAPLGIPTEAVRQTSDRHWTLCVYKSGFQKAAFQKPSPGRSS
jgi:ubiquinone/menaquinone biosynthesis C-methylase UbiE